MAKHNMTLDEIEQIACKALERVGTRKESAASLAHAIMAAERDGIQSHGLVYVPVYCEHVQCGKVIGDAIPAVTVPATSSISVDARSGFAHPAIDAGFEHLVPISQKCGVAGMAIRNSYNCGVLGYHVERLASEGLVGLGFTNAPASIAPSGGTTPVIGTNPFALAVPGKNNIAAFVIDQSASVVAKSEIMMHARNGQPIPVGWGLDSKGEPTTDPDIALKGSMAPSGGYKGFGVGLLVETFAAALTGAMLGKDASPFSGTLGGPPKTGQFFIAISPESFSGETFSSRINDLTKEIINQPGARIPGERRKNNREQHTRDGVLVDGALLSRIQDIILS